MIEHGISQKTAARREGEQPPQRTSAHRDGRHSLRQHVARKRDGHPGDGYVLGPSLQQAGKDERKTKDIDAKRADPSQRGRPDFTGDIARGTQHINRGQGADRDEDGLSIVRQRRRTRGESRRRFFWAKSITANRNQGAN